MKKVFLITDDDALRQAASGAAAKLGADVETCRRWLEAKDALFKERYDAVCIDYDAIKIEGLDAFILLDNVLQKEQTPGVLILRQPSARAKQFISSLDSFAKSIELQGAQPTEQRLAKPMRSLLEESAAAQPSPADPSAETTPVVVEVRLPTLDAGSLDQISLGRLLYTLTQSCSSGVLHLKNDSIQRRYAIREGAPVEVKGDAFADLSTLASAFAWQGGHYQFNKGWRGKGEAVEPLGFIYRCLERHVPQRRVMQSMMTHMKAYPTATNLWAKRHDKLKGLDLVEKFFGACDGETNLEQALASLGSDATAGFKAALFAVQTDFILMRTDPTPEGVTVQYDGAVARAQQKRVEAQKKASKAYRATGTGRLDLEQELREYLDDVEQATPYQMFDVWEGCGRKIIQNKFYEMVKLHHPDVYGGNVSGDVKQLAQEIFIAIKDAYTELIKVEGEQLCADPRPRTQSGAGAVSETMTRPSSTTDSSAPSPGAHTTQERIRPSGTAKRPTPTSSLSAAKSEAHGEAVGFGAEPAPGATGADDAARKSRVERLKAKRHSTPIGLGREPSTPIVKGKSRKSTVRENTEERKARLDKIRRNSTTGISGTGTMKSDDLAKQAFNQGYQAFRDAENEKVALDRFSTAYNLEPDNGKYMTFYGYLLFLNDAAKRDEAQKVLQKAIELGDRQSLPDAHVFLGHILKVKEQHNKAVGHFKKALQLNPKSREAQRELRLYQMRKNAKDGSGDNAGFLKNLFNK
ncbi:MAG: DUF4388 domain-containing protein [Persicimonas sp.]